MALQCILGLKCNNFAMIAADQMFIENIFVMKDDDEKIHKISEAMIMGVSGDVADSTQLLQYIQKHLQLYKMKNKYPLDIGEVAHFVRKNMTGWWRTGTGPQQQEGMFSVSFLLAGYDAVNGGRLWYLDSLGTCLEIPHVGLGFGGILCESIIDRYYSPSLTELEAYELLSLCTRQIDHRLFLQLPKFQVALVSSQGVKQLPPLVTKSVYFD